MKRKIKFLDLFAGCGGFSDGFLQNKNFESTYHIEWELPMVEVLRKRLNQKWGKSEQEAMHEVIHFDIQKINELLTGKWEMLPDKAYTTTNSNELKEKGLRKLLEDTEIDVIIGGPPCQAYSIAGRAQDTCNMENDYRNFLFESFNKFLIEFKPKIFLFENVPGMLSAKPGGKSVISRISKKFKQSGYIIPSEKEFKNCVFNTSDFGVPQDRKRVIIIGLRNDLYESSSLEEIYNEIRSIKASKKTTVKEALKGLPKIPPLPDILLNKKGNQSHQKTDVPFHNSRYHNLRDQSIFKEWVDNKMNTKSNDEKLEFYTNKVGKITKVAKYRNLEWDKPSPTIVAHLEKDGLLFIHPDGDQKRTITIREAARLQSFDDDFNFHTSIGKSYKMIGNAVPPKMALKLSKVIEKYL